MSTATMRVTIDARDTIRQLARETGMKQQQVIENAVENYRRHVFLESANAAYSTLQSDASAWKEEQEERAVWDETLADGREES